MERFRMGIGTFFLSVAHYLKAQAVVFVDLFSSIRDTRDTSIRAPGKSLRILAAASLAPVDGQHRPSTQGYPALPGRIPSTCRT